MQFQQASSGEDIDFSAGFFRRQFSKAIYPLGSELFINKQCHRNSKYTYLLSTENFYRVSHFLSSVHLLALHGA